MMSAAQAPSKGASSTCFLSLSSGSLWELAKSSDAMAWEHARLCQVHSGDKILTEAHKQTEVRSALFPIYKWEHNASQRCCEPNHKAGKQESHVWTQVIWLQVHSSTLCHMAAGRSHSVSFTPESGFLTQRKSRLTVGRWFTLKMVWAISSSRHWHLASNKL